MSVDKGGENMRQKYIRELFLGEIHPADSRGFENEEYEKWQNEFTKLYREIQALLPEDKRKRLELLCATRKTLLTLQCKRRSLSTDFAMALNWAQIL